jgi:ureidoglycolate dehydrogenase (NAD+)
LAGALPAPSRTPEQSYFSSTLAERGLIGLVMTASKLLMSYFGAKGEALSTNPLSIAVPVAEGADPILRDMSTAAVALGKIMAAKDAGKPIPLGWAMDETGAGGCHVWMAPVWQCDC